MNTSLLINPFGKISGLTALLIGLAGIPLSAFLMGFAGCGYTGAIFMSCGGGMSFKALLFSHACIWLVCSCVFYLIGQAASKKEVKASEVFGYVAFAQLPYGLAVLRSILPGLPDYRGRLLGEDGHITKTVDFLLQLLNSAYSVLITLLTLGVILWVFALMFNAVKASLGLSGERLFWLFLLGMLISETILRALIYWIPAQGFLSL